MDQDIAALQALVSASGRDDLADLLIRASCQLEPSTAYGAQWHSFLATFILELPAEDYVCVRKLPEDDYHFLMQCIKELYPPREGSYEITAIEIAIQKSAHTPESRRHHRLTHLALSWLQRAKNMKITGELNHAQAHYAEAISNAQECIELSLKALYVTILPTYPKQHDFTDTECRSLLAQAPRSLREIIPKLVMYLRFWRNFYALAKYGHEVLLIGPEHLFGVDEAELALHHAQTCLEVVQNKLNTALPKGPGAQAASGDAPAHNAVTQPDKTEAPP